jgi:hypothetical protein
LGEPNKSNTKFRYELEKTWDTERRLKTWNKIIFKKKTNEKKQNFSIFGNELINKFQKIDLTNN